jgi:hypothetical protein
VNIRFRNALLTGIAVGFGLIVLIGYLIPPDISDVFFKVRLQLLTWASLLAAVAVIIGAYNLMRVHFGKMLAGSPGWFYSLFTILGFFIALLIGLFGSQLAGGTGLANPINDFVFQHLIGATSTALSAMLVFFLLFAGYRLARRPLTLTTTLFLGTAVVALIGMAPNLRDFFLPEEVNYFWLWLSQVWAVAGARGLLLGIALGIVATGVRVLLAMDRPYGD